MVSKSIGNTTLSANLKASLDEHLASLREDIASRADEIANAGLPTTDTNRNPVDIQSLSQAIAEAIGGGVGPAPKLRLFDLFPPFTCVCALLCLAFAALGLLPLYADPAVAAKAATSTTGFLDIAKIFAGAIVGSTTSIALSSARSRRGRQL